MAERRLDEHGNTLFHWAAGFGSMQVVRLLLSSGAPVNALSDRGWSPLTEAEYWAREYALKATPQCSAKAADCLKVVALLQDVGGQRIGEPETASSKWRRQKESTGYATNSTGGADSKATQERKRLLPAAKRGDCKSLSQWLGKVPDAMRVADGSGSTALHHAAEYGRLDAVKLLVARGAQVNCTSNRGWSPLTVAKYWASECAHRGDDRTAAQCTGVAVFLEDQGALQLGHPETSSSRTRRWLENQSYPMLRDAADETFDPLVLPEDSVSNASWPHSSDVPPPPPVAPVYETIIEEANSEFGSAHSNKSALTLTSVSGEQGQGHCFLADAVFRTPKGLKKARELEEGAEVYAWGGTLTRVRAFELQPMDRQELVELCAGEACLRVTASHRTMVHRNGRNQTIAAGLLGLNDIVTCSSSVRSDEQRALTGCMRLWKDVEIAQITFFPDVPVETYHLPDHSILSKVMCVKKTRRSGMERRRNAGQNSGSAHSIPDTADSWY